jgi:hypothetical protein
LVNSSILINNYKNMSRLPIPHATLSSSISQTAAATTVSYPFLFEDTDDILGLNRDGGTCSINSASPCTVTCVAPATTILAVGAPIMFTVLSDETKGITTTAVYYMTNIAGGAATFQLSSTIALARAGTANINTTGAITGTFQCISRIYFKESGDYEIIISGLLDSTGITGATPQTMDVWFVKGNSTSDLVGTNVPSSNTQCATDRAGIQLTVAVPLIFEAETNDFIRIDYKVRDVRLGWYALAAVVANPGVTPAIPACPSLILTCKKLCR